MPMQKIQTVTGTGIPLLLDDIDTDRIIPARFLRCVTFDGLGEHAFEDDRRQDALHPFEDNRFKGSNVLIAGRNFGCGSSREHAPQSLMRWGVRAIIAESYAEIFLGNCTSLGIPAVTASRGDLERLESAILANPQLEITVDLMANVVSSTGASFDIEMAESAREALTTGQWDFLAELLDARDEISETAGKIPYVAGF